ncbi:MAG: type IX secretion system membrane protein PorP/SprF, partial [Bacteroidota bacterium]
ELYNTSIGLPSQVSVGTLPGLRLVHQQRGLVINGWKSAGQQVHFRYPDLGHTGRFGLGFSARHDLLHSERRIAINAVVGTNLIETKALELSVGISGGLINQASIYQDVAVYNHSDPLLINARNLIELDAGFGAGLACRTPLFRGDVNVNAQQVAGNLMTRHILGFRLAPHIQASGGMGFPLAHNLYLGPRFLYQNTIFRQDTTLQKANLDIGLKTNFERQGLWLGGGYRIHRGALHAGFGLRISGTDTTDNFSGAAHFLDLVFDFSYPTNASSVFGPTLEFGLSLVFGRPRSKAQIDTLRMARTFWKNDANLNFHKVRFLTANGPPGLTAATSPGESRVSVTYAFPDHSFLFIGETSKRASATQLAEIGPEWPGVDGFLENLAGEVIREALSPNEEGIEDPENLEALKHLISIELAADLRVDQVGAHLGAKGQVYEGELGTDHPDTDTLSIAIVFDGADTTLAIVRHRYLTNLELATLKLHSMRQKLEFELNRLFGGDMAFVSEGGKFRYEDLDGRRPVVVKKLRVKTENVHLQAAQRNLVRLKFSRWKVLRDDDGKVTEDRKVIWRTRKR